MKDFEFVPYLNSSLFEVTELESNTIKINSLSQRSELPLFTNSVLINRKEKQQFNSLPTLNYLFAFWMHIILQAKAVRKFKKKPRL